MVINKIMLAKGKLYKTHPKLVNSLLIIGILSLSFSLSFLIRIQPAEFGFELNEFDPFFNFRATQFVIDNELEAYFNWHDDMSWYYAGRDISATSQVMLHITAAALYQVFGFGSSLYDFTIIFPVVFGSLTAIVFFALVRTMYGTTAGLFSSLLFAISSPIIDRGTIGWFKSEPLGLFYGILSIYLLLSGIQSKNKKIMVAKLVASGIIFSLGLSSWGGVTFFVIPLGIFFVLLPLFRKDYNFPVWAIPVFTTVVMLSSLGFERLVTSFVIGVAGFVLVASTVYLTTLMIIQKFDTQKKWKMRYTIISLTIFILIGVTIILAGIIALPQTRYLEAIFPIYVDEPLFSSISEHSELSISDHFSSFSVLFIFAGIGLWLLFRKNKNKSISFLAKIGSIRVFVIALCISGIYVGTNFSRLLVFEAISIIILTSISLAFISTKILHKKKINKIAIFLIFSLLLLPLIFPVDSNWITRHAYPPVIFTGGAVLVEPANDWLVSLEWIKNNTPKDAVIAAWWDYGYWITTVGERTTLVDNAAYASPPTISLMSKMFLDSPENSYAFFKKYDVDYFLVFVTAQKISDEFDYYIIGGGGGSYESNIENFARIANIEHTQFFKDDGITLNEYFWKNTFLGNMLPFEKTFYYNIGTGTRSDSYQPGFTAIYEKTMKNYVDEDIQLKLVYSSPSLDRKDSGSIVGILIYEVNMNS